MNTSDSVSVYCESRDRRSAQEREDRIFGLKFLAAHLPKPSDRLQCFMEILRERSEQLRQEVEAPR